MTTDNLLFTTLHDNGHLHEECLFLIERAFEYAPEQRFDVDFYPLMSEANKKNNHIIVDRSSNRVIGHIGVCLRELGNSDFSTPVALVGGIAIEEEFRGRGLFSRLMNHIIDHYNDNVSLFILWSEKDAMYEKYGFIQAGGIVETSSNTDLSEEITSSYTKTTYAELTPTEREEIHSIYSDVITKNYTTFLRGEREWSDVEQITSADLYIRREDKKIASYFFSGKGFDLQGVIHEFGYLPTNKDETINTLSSSRLWLSEADLSYSDADQLLFMALFRPGSEKLFSNFIHSWSKGELEVESINDEGVNFVYLGERYTEPYHNFLPGLFGPGPIAEFENYGPPLYLSGLDSI